MKLPLCRVKVVLNSKRKSHHVRTVNQISTGFREICFSRMKGIVFTKGRVMSKELDKNQSVIVDGLLKMSDAERSSLMKKIDVAYLVAREEMLFTKFKQILKLE